MTIRAPLAFIDDTLTVLTIFVAAADISGLNGEDVREMVADVPS